MLNTSDFLKTMKNVTTDTIESSKPVNIAFGKVINQSPLQINVDQKMTLGELQLILTRNVTDYVTNVTINWNTANTSGGSGEGSFASHSHSLNGTKQVTINNALKVGENVVLLRVQGGQKYLVLDRLKQ